MSDDLYLALEIGGTKLQAVLGFLDGGDTIVRRGIAPAERGAQAILEWFRGPVPELVGEAEKLGKRVRRIGVGFGGPVDSATGAVLVSHQVSGWNGFALKAWFEDNFGIETAVFNDSSAAGWGEYVLGAGRGVRTFLYSNIGSGIGGGLVIDGKLQDGRGYGAAEVGHTLVPDWSVDAPGVPRKLEQLCSGWAIERRVRSGPDPASGTPLHDLSGGRAASLTCAMLGEAARRGDAVALAEIDRVARSIGVSLANVVTLLHPERIAMGGGVSLLGDILLDPIRRYVNEYAFGPFQNKFDIVPSELGESVVTMGTLLLAGAKIR